MSSDQGERYIHPLREAARQAASAELLRRVKEMDEQTPETVRQAPTSDLIEALISVTSNIVEIQELVEGSHDPVPVDVVLTTYANAASRVRVLYKAEIDRRMPAP